MKICAVIPAAGKGTRLGLNSESAKILLPITNQISIWTILRNLLLENVEHIHVVLAPSFEKQFTSQLKKEDRQSLISTSIQNQALGMGDAIFGAYKAWSEYDFILVVWGDQVNLSQETILRVTTACHGQNTIVLPLVQMQSPYVQYDLQGTQLIQVRQAREGDKLDSKGASDVGVFALSVNDLMINWSNYLEKSATGKQTGEINFLPFMAFLSKECGWKVQTIDIADPIEARGVNTPEVLRFAKERFQTLYD